MSCNNLILSNPGLNWPSREADKSPPSIAEFKDVGALPPVTNTTSYRGD